MDAVQRCGDRKSHIDEAHRQMKRGKMQIAEKARGGNIHSPRKHAEHRHGFGYPEFPRYGLFHLPSAFLFAQFPAALPAERILPFHRRAAVWAEPVFVRSRFGRRFRTLCTKTLVQRVGFFPVVHNIKG